jgi:hypothetical protein
MSISKSAAQRPPGFLAQRLGRRRRVGAQGFLDLFLDRRDGVLIRLEVMRAALGPEDFEEPHAGPEAGEAKSVRCHSHWDGRD